MYVYSVYIYIPLKSYGLYIYVYCYHYISKNIGEVIIMTPGRFIGLHI